MRPVANDDQAIRKDYEATWQIGLDEFKIFVEAFGHSLVPTAYVAPSGHRLGSWISTNRQGKIRLNNERIRKLDQLGFVWEVNNINDEIMMKELRNFKEENGHLLVPQGYVSPSGYRLGQMVGYLRDRMRIGKISESRVLELESIGMKINAFDVAWDRFIEELDRYRLANGDLLVPSRHQTNDGYRLGSRVTNLRSKHRKGELRPERESQLIDMGFVWSSKVSIRGKRQSPKPMEGETHV